MCLCAEKLDMYVEQADMLLIIFIDLQHYLWSFPFVHSLIKLQALERKYVLKLIQCGAVPNIPWRMLWETGMGKSH